ncbi:MAG: TDT family transporter [Bacillota bacterium]|nr:TDT family transporter [Bacillota bacterium]MDW7684871.1 TDT family transporter [Bacillota bacterium]
MDRIIGKVPVPLAGLMLALAVLGNMLSSYGPVYRNTAGLLAACLLLLLAAKLVRNPGCIREGFSNPVTASVIPTFSMGVMILSTYIQHLNYGLAYGTWLLGLVMHIVLIVSFSKHYLFSFRIQKVYPSYFIVYVGIVAGSVTAPAYNLAHLGQFLFWFGFIANLLLLPFVLYRVFFVQAIPESALPTQIIFAAPASLCLVGYLNTFAIRSVAMVGFLVLFALIMAVVAVSFLPGLLKLQFYPSYSSFTFPFVISAAAIKGAHGFLLSQGWNVAPLAYTGIFLEFLSVLMVFYVLVRYIAYLMPFTIVLVPVEERPA